jgi:hypothetical protein
VSKQQSNFEAIHLSNTQLEKCAQDVHEGVGFGIEFLIQFSLPPIPLTIRKMMPQGGFGDFRIYSLIRLQGWVAQSVANQKSKVGMRPLDFHLPHSKKV